MQLEKATMLTHEGKEYVVEGWRLELGYVVTVSHNQVQFGPKYGITYPVAWEFDAFQGMSALDALMQLAQDDIRRGLVRAE